MNSVQSYIFEQVKQHKLSQKEAKRMLKELKAASSNEDIAIIGISCRLPKANNTDEYWKNLMNGEDCKAEYPKDMINYIKPIVNNKGFTDFLGSGYLTEEQADNWKPGGYLEDVDKFDPEFLIFLLKKQRPLTRLTEYCWRRYGLRLKIQGMQGTKFMEATHRSLLEKTMSIIRCTATLQNQNRQV